MDNRRNNGGKRNGAGRKPKTEELELIEKLTPLDDIAFKAIEKGVKAGSFHFIKLFMEYRFGKPIQQIETGNENGSVIIIDC